MILKFFKIMEHLLFIIKIKIWAWNWIDVNKVIKIKLTTIKNILIKEKWGNTIFDVVLDVQGAELKVLRGFSKKSLNH